MAALRILIAPDKFKGSMRAREVADALARGAARAFPEASIDVVPVSDGGEGTLDALLDAVGGTVSTVSVTGPLRARVQAPVALLSDGRAVLEVAGASGLVLVEEGRRDALRASSYGTGELVAAASAAGAREVVVAVGGSASSDGGTGAARALGWRFLDRAGRELPLGGGALRRLQRIVPPAADGALDGVAVVGACDVSNPLLGESGAARVFGPQKGAGPAEVEVLEEGLATLARRIEEDLGVDVAARSSAGACGGIGAGLIAFFGAALTSGFDLVADAVGLAAAVAESDLVLTGEGRLDAQSARGKAVAGVARLASRAGVPCVAIAGDLELTRSELARMGFAGGLSLCAEVGAARALHDTGSALEEVASDLRRRLGDG